MHCLHSPKLRDCSLIFSLSLTRLLPGEEKFIPQLGCEVIACFLLKTQRHLFLLGQQLTLSVTA